MGLPTWPCAGLRIDSRGVVKQSNAALWNLVGAVAADEIDGRPFDALLTGASRVLYQSYLQPLLRMHGNVEEISLTVKTREGTALDVLFYSTSRTLADGSPGVEVILAPIRRRRGIEDEMLRIKRAADHAPGLIFQLLQLPGGVQHFPFVSQAVRRLYEVTGDEANATAEALFQRIVPADREDLHRAMDAAGDRGEDWVGSYRVLLASGHTHWHEMQCTPRDLAGSVRVWHGHIADVTARRHLEATLAERAAHERMNAVRSEFLARVSHELRTPLNGIIGFAQVMDADQADPLTPGQADRLAVIGAAGRHLLQLVNQVLDITSIESPQTSVELQPVPMQAAIGQALALVQAQAATAGVELLLGELPQGLRVVADELRLRQVLVNLLANAIKYNRAGGQVRVRAERDGADRVRVAISDTGFGLTAQQQAQLFQPFNRLGAESRGAEGTGLGLVITRHLLNMMGGSIEVHSSPGVGSTFSFVLRSQDLAPSGAAGLAAAATSELQPASASTAAAACGRVLCVEDNPVNAVLMEAIIGMRPDITLCMVGDAASALTALDSFTPDLLLLDMHLPDMTGSALLQVMRARQPPCLAPAVMVSAAARADDIARAMAAGFESYWTKPLDIDRALAELDRLLRPAGP